MSDEIPNHNGDSNEQMAAGLLPKSRKARRLRLTAAFIVDALRNGRGKNHQLAPERNADILPCPGGCKCSKRQPIHKVLS